MEKQHIPAASVDVGFSSMTTVEHRDRGDNDEKTLEGGIPTTSPEEIAKTIRKMDMVVLPVMTMVLALCYIDRSNMGLAHVAGMADELHFKGYQYSISLLVFFPGYVLFVIPSNYVLSKTSVRNWLTFLSFAFGMFSVGIGLVRNFGSLVAMRMLLGVCEAGVFPAIIMVLSSWYPRYYFGKRMAMVNSAAGLISALSGILAYAFSRINVPHYHGWRWIFLLEGALTVVMAVIAFFTLDEYPNKSRFLNKEQRDIAVGLIAQDREEHSEENLTVRLVLEHLHDWKIWVFGTMYMMSVTVTYGLAYFIPLILNGAMGFDGALSQVLSTPPYIYCFLLSLVVPWISDHVRLRGPIIVGLALSVILGITLTRWGPNTGSRYLGLFFSMGGSLLNGPMIIIFAQNNAPKRTKRSVSSGMQLSWGAIGGIIGSTVFRSQDAPEYTPGVAVVLCITFVLMGVTCAMDLHFRRLNRLHIETGLVLEGQADFVHTL